jgi:predicted O-methyltransferase YrrM
MNINIDSPGYGTDPSIFGGIQVKTKYGIVPAYCLDNTRNFIKTRLSSVYSGIFVEIGVYGGSTLLDIYDICKTNNNQIYGIDPWDKITIFNGQNYSECNATVINQEINRYRQVKENLMNIITINNLNINIHNENSWDVYNTFKENSISCIHIDGDHSYEGVKKDLKLYWSKIKNGGMIINDDYHWGGVKRAIDEFINNHKDNIITYYSIQNGEKNVIIKR